MFSKEVIDTDLFLSLSRGAQNLYFHLALRADDDGFVNNPLRLQKMLDGQDSEMEELIKKEFILLFESGVIVIKHWKVHNYIKTDRYKETICKEEKKLLALDENKAYIIVEPDWNQIGTKMEPQVRLESGKDSLGEDSLLIQNKTTENKMKLSWFFEKTKLTNH